MKITGIYRIQSKIKPERIYVGSAGNIHQRFAEHKSNLRTHTHTNQKLQRHYDKYGSDDLEFFVIVGCPKDALIVYEQFYIDALDPYFNICKVAGSPLGREPWNKGKTLSEEHKRNIGKSMEGERNSMYGIPAPIKGTKGMCPNKYKGTKGRYSEETLEKMRKSNKLAWEKRRQKKEELCRELE
jgi:group I intron endonuclease